jgi:DHA1 family bicyclomycin/chloramphenicol resistance-like MFS transporter
MTALPSSPVLDTTADSGSARSSARIRPESAGFIVLLSALGGLTPLSIDMGLPALQAISHSLIVPPASAALTLSFFLIGFAFGPVVLGPISDRFGRRPVLLAGLSLFAVAGIGCALASSLSALLFWRLLEGIGAGAGSTLSLAIVRDLFDGATARVRLSYVGTIGSFAPMLAPTLGAIVLAFLGWRSIYGFLGTAGFALLATIYFGFKESHPNPDVTALQPKRIAANYARIFTNRICLGYALVVSFNFGSMFSYISSSPLVMMGVLGVSPTYYGWTFAATALGIMTGAFINGRLNRRGVPAATLLVAGLILSTLSALSLLAVSYSAHAAVQTILPLLVLNTFSIGFIGPNATQGVMQPLPDMAGVAAAVMGSMRMVVGATAGFIVAFLFDNKTAHAMAESMCLFSFAALTAYLAVVRVAERAAAVLKATSPAIEASQINA